MVSFRLTRSGQGGELVIHKQHLMTVEAEVCAPSVMAQLACFNVMEPADSIMRVEDTYRLDFSLTPRPRNTRGCYRDHWSPHRFERIGNVFLLPPKENMQARTDGGIPQSSVVCHMRSDSIRQWFEDDMQWTDRRLAASLDITEPNVRNLMLRLADELRHPGFASQVLVELIAAQAAIEIARYCSGIQEGPATGGLASWRLRRIDERLKEMREAPTLSELAALCNLSVRQLTRGFRVSRGESIGDHVAQVRIDHAKRMLGTDQSVKAIAYSLGFSSPSSFSFAFRRATGRTPREFRQRLTLS